MYKVLYITQYTGLMGANLALLEMMIELRDKYGIKPVVLVSKRKGALLDKLKEEKIDYIVMPFTMSVKIKGKKQYIKVSMKKIINSISAFIIADRIKNENFDIIHTNTSVIDIGAKIAKKNKLKHIWHIREFLEFYEFEYYNEHNINKYYNILSNKVIVISNSLHGYYSKYIQKEKLKIIHDGLSFNVDEKLKKDKEKVNFIVVGSLCDGKNQLECLKAVKVLKDKKINNFFVTIVGTGNSEYRDSLIDYTKDNNIDKFVDFTGYMTHNDVKKILIENDVGIVCSKKEAFGRVTIEYMLNRMPVIASNIAANIELIECDKNGVRYELGNVNQLAEEMEKFIFNKKKIEYMGNNAYKVAKEKYSLEKCIENIYETYFELMNS